MTINYQPLQHIEAANMKDLYAQIPFNKSILENLSFDYERTGSFFDFAKDYELYYWRNMLVNRMNLLMRNYAYTMFYYNQYITDEVWHKSPGSKGQSVKLFPDFKDEDYTKYFNFNCFSEYFFLQGFSIFELFGHIIVNLYDIKLKENNISFHKAVDKLESKNKTKFKELDKVRKSSEFKMASRHRNDITHNQHPQFISSGITKDDSGMVAVGIGEYTPSQKVKEIMDGMLICLEKIIEILNDNVE
ncbi:Cthe_2314 family HEPN domain-containing protein [Mammaliicoccus sciuri]|uniref:Cthe_2314 family HEPN domain-containing protein n=1 Tax=Mammaliicoccus sciuri TaxID=1296 RepID=UPI0034DD9982